MQKLKQWGLPDNIIQKINRKELDSNEIARVIAVHKERYDIEHSYGRMRAEITGNLRFSAQSSTDFPAVGDWVRIVKMDENTAVIIEVFPRITVLKREAVGKSTELQIIASNIDEAFICMSVDQNFNLNRIDRYLAICKEEDIDATVILTKSDLVLKDLIAEYVSRINFRHKHIKVLVLSTKTREGLMGFYELFEKAKTYCFLGSSGVGKSTLVNDLLGKEKMKTTNLSSSNLKGRHTTTHRELFLLPNGSLVIDTPGMRELGMGHADNGINVVFDQISELSSGCKFKDCTHTSEPGCAILNAIEDGRISDEAYGNYLKLRKEQAYYNEKETEKRQKGKQLSKLIKEYDRIKKSRQ